MNHDTDPYRSILLAPHFGDRGLYRPLRSACDDLYARAFRVWKWRFTQRNIQAQPVVVVCFFAYFHYYWHLPNDR